MKRIAIIDNTVLANFADMNSLNLLRNLFSMILVPVEVRNEFEKYSSSRLPVNRSIFLNKLKIDYGFFRLCNTYDPIILDSTTGYKSLHKGESEAIAQAFKRKINLLLTDDKNCIKIIDENFDNIRCLDTIMLLAIVDVGGFLYNRDSLFKQLYGKHKYTSSTLRIAYKFAFKYYGIQADKKILSKKTSLKSILS